MTSDAKPFRAGGTARVCQRCAAVQEAGDGRWEREAAAIYGVYEMFALSDGCDQAVFADGAAQPRCRALLDRASAHLALPAGARILDVGCGSGAMLEAAANAFPGCELHGHDLDARCEKRLAQIPGFERLFVGDLDALPGGFDLITSSHSLEHMPDPVACLEQLAVRLADGGRLLLQVPDVAASPFELLVADHRTHFDRDSLTNAARRADIEIDLCADDWIGKELSLIGRRGVAPHRGRPEVEGISERCEHVMAQTATQVRWLVQLLEDAGKLAESASSFGLFGTSIAGSWAFGPLADRVQFFVDEDPARVGRRHLGRPVVHPDRIPRGASVYVPLLPHVAQHVAARIDRSDRQIRVPQPIADFEFRVRPR